MSLNTLPLVFDGRRYTIRNVTHENVYGLVVFLDALGIKGIWQKKDPSEVLNNWSKIYYLFNDELQKHFSGVCLSAFSDTIIISVRGHKELIDRPWGFVELLCRGLMSPFVMSMNYDFFFRGVIAMDAFSRSSRMLIGPAADEAAQFYEDSDWSGIALSPSLGSVLENSVSSGSKIVIKYPVPQKRNSQELNWAINWTIGDPAGKCRRILMDKYNLYLHSYNTYGSPKDYAVCMKYKNALEFYDSCSSLL
jgi:hypothetical protein